MRARRAGSPIAVRISEISVVRFASDTKVSGHREAWISSLETAFGARSSRSSRSASPLGESVTTFSSRQSWRVSESKTHLPNRLRTGLWRQSWETPGTP